MRKNPEWAKDTFTRGAVCGLIAGAVKDVLDYLATPLMTKKDYFWYYAGAISMFRLPKTPLEIVFSIMVELLFSTVLGVVFCAIHQRGRTRRFIPLGIFYGSIVWFIIQTGVLIFHVTVLQEADKSVSVAISEWVLSMVYGIIVAWLEHRVYTPEG